MRGGGESGKFWFFNTDAGSSPHPNPLPIRWDEREACALVQSSLAALFSNLRIHQ